MKEFKSKIFTLPGLGNSGEQHWQSHWERQYPELERINQKDWETPVCDDWTAAIDEKITGQDQKNVILVGHSLACSTIVQWVKKYNRIIKGALLVAPSDTEAPTYPRGTTGFVPVPLIRLPFRSIVIASSDDVYVPPERAGFFAECWGSEFVNIGKAGHINTASGYGLWAQGLEYLKKLDKE
jgi:predicted alpha/beta hydrolase family esterase